jgi:glycosyltransferase involved in cell wall biosynthesis
MSADLIVFGEDWGAHPSSTQHLVRHLARDRRVVWVNSIGLRRPRLVAADIRRAARKLSAALWPAKGKAAGAAQEAAGARPFPVVQPMAIPMAQGRLTRAVNARMIGGPVRAAAAAAGMRRPVIWATLPSAVCALGQIDAAAVVYYCCDDFGALAGVDHAAAREMEAELANRADLILAASPALAARFPAHKTYLLEHGVDLGLFGAEAARPADMPDGPVAGFYGTLADWIDLDLVAATARLLPDWTFLMIGPVATDTRALDGLANVRLVGPRDHAALAGYARHWTAGIIPFRDTPQIQACNPLKLREYLAAGRPVVSTPFPALMPYAAEMSVTSDAAGFAAALEATRTDAPAGVGRRQALVARESWAARASQAAGLLDVLAA